MKKFIFSSVSLEWEDDRYMVECPQMEEVARQRALRRGDQTEDKEKEDKPCVDNSQRLSRCPSNSVIWNEDNQFWVPGLDVEDALEVVVKHLN